MPQLVSGIERISRDRSRLVIPQLDCPKVEEEVSSIKRTRFGKFNLTKKKKWSKQPQTNRNRPHQL